MKDYELLEHLLLLIKAALDANLLDTASELSVIYQRIKSVQTQLGGSV